MTREAGFRNPSRLLTNSINLSSGGCRNPAEGSPIGHLQERETLFPAERERVVSLSLDDLSFFVIVTLFPKDNERLSLFCSILGGGC
ncbi:hypothetical protein AKJ39_04095 [candidate division MSBL1 archaeon SCGC-AAA259J03]|uniref:Uncharacterized protein n=2 Tax=candidate division MSBL1 TaxID=215777 RepID=A0A133U4M7_9EURY|nr:hypothetical protein AKJ57_05835 [candidate division MSBL1 archaeon SCGC-AAA259A05]KXA96821.1 hypothetical protein AKJ39_04095 [candidate division MSBL1 archaeon SCGC-AAA259J03]